MKEIVGCYVILIWLGPRDHLSGKKGEMFPIAGSKMLFLSILDMPFGTCRRVGSATYTGYFQEKVCLLILFIEKGFVYFGMNYIWVIFSLLFF
jgi:hypothetical protein